MDGEEGNRPGREGKEGKGEEKGEREKTRQRLSFKKINILQPSLTGSSTLVF